MIHGYTEPTADSVPARCAQHPAYDADYCPICGTARVIGR